jgi:thiazole tautomerase (transcriptional regulator TenI)
LEQELHVITTGQQQSAEIVEIVAHIHPYVDTIHLREKQMTAKELGNLVSSLLDQGVPASKMVVNDRVDVAVVYSLKGVQLAYHSLDVKRVKDHFPSLQVGCSVHSLEEALAAARHGADYFVYGHIFPTASKKGLQPRGIQALTQIANEVPIPVIGIGGITVENAVHVLNAGAKGIAVMSGVFLAKDPVSAVKAYSRLLKNWRAKHGKQTI